MRTVESRTVLIDGMEYREFARVTTDPKLSEVHLAERCTKAYVIGLEVGTMLSRAPRQITSFVGGKEGQRDWSAQKLELEAQFHGIINDDIRNLKAFELGGIAGMERPLNQFTVNGVSHE